MEWNDQRRGFLKYVFSSIAFTVTSIFSFKIKKYEGFKIGRRSYPYGPSAASGQCGTSNSCTGERGDSYIPPNGGGQCGASYDCAGGGGKCGGSYDCAGS